MAIIGMIILGALAGWIASMVTGRNASMNWFENIIVGILGAIVGGMLVRVITGHSVVSGFNIPALLVAIVGAVILLFIWGAIRARA